MKTEYILEADPEKGRAEEMTDEQYNQLVSDGKAVFESPEEYGDFMCILRVKNPAGQEVWLGLR